MKSTVNLVATIALLSFLGLSLTACDIEPVSVGTWDIEVTAPSGKQHSVWTITASGRITMNGNTTTVVDGASLAGSRIAWSYALPHPEIPGQEINANFDGTINGDRLQGTLFTTLGNQSVSGMRR